MSFECFCVGIVIENRERFFPSEREEPAKELEWLPIFSKWRAIGAGKGREIRPPWEQKWGGGRERDNLLKHIAKFIFLLIFFKFML